MCADSAIADVSKTAERLTQTREMQQPSFPNTLAALLDEHLTRRAARTWRERSPDT
jgi:hypothetical protein